MKIQRNLSFDIADLIIERVKQYLSEVNCLDEQTFLWVDWDACSVYLGKSDEEHNGDKIPVCDFIFDNGKCLTVDYDLVDTYATSEWPDHRK